jgi:hypothetical protein
MNTNIDLFGHLPKPTNIEMNSTKEKTDVHDDAGQKHQTEIDNTDDRGVKGLLSNNSFRNLILEPFKGKAIEATAEDYSEDAYQVYKSSVDRSEKSGRRKVIDQTAGWHKRGEAIAAFFSANKGREWLKNWIAKNLALNCFKGALFTAGHMQTLAFKPKVSKYAKKAQDDGWMTIDNKKQYKPKYG